MNTFCTIITADYYPKALALCKSIIKFNPDIQLQVLIADGKALPDKTVVPANIKIIPVSQLSGYWLVDDLYRKYAHIEMDFFRWSMKPVFISWLLENGFDKVLYLDCDMFFFNSYDFLFRELDNSSILLTPHWENSDPLTDKDSFLTLFTNGFFPAGFIGVNKEGLPAMQWWANACHFMMGSHINYGIHDDQKYLDIFPVKFENTCIIRHRGCNVGAWNYEECKRELVNGELLINGKYPVIFIHFDGMMIQGILRGHDNLLLPCFELYKRTFEESGASLSGFIKEIDTHINAGMLIRGKWKLRLRTRFKKFLYKLAEKL